MPHRTAARLRALLDQLQKAQDESGGLSKQARQDVAEAMSIGELRPVGTSGGSIRKKKAGKKKR